MSRKGENIYKRKDGRWEARYIKAYTIDGKAKYGYCYAASYHEVREKVSLVKAALLSDSQAVTGKIIPGLWQILRLPILKNQKKK